MCCRSNLETSVLRKDFFKLGNNLACLSHELDNILVAKEEFCDFTFYFLFF